MLWGNNYYECSYLKAFNFEEELPEYDMDTEDEEWLKAFNKKKVRLIHHVHLS